MRAAGCRRRRRRSGRALSSKRGLQAVFEELSMTYQNDIPMKQSTHIGGVAHAAALVAHAAGQGGEGLQKS